MSDGLLITHITGLVSSLATSCSPAAWSTIYGVSFIISSSPFLYVLWIIAELVNPILSTRPLQMIVFSGILMSWYLMELLQELITKIFIKINWWVVMVNREWAVLNGQW